jgi:hypothetical protein
MNKRKKVAWHKHLKAMKRRDEKAHATRTTTPTTPLRPAVKR